MYAEVNSSFHIAKLEEMLNYMTLESDAKNTEIMRHIICGNQLSTLYSSIKEIQLTKTNSALRQMLMHFKAQ